MEIVLKVSAVTVITAVCVLIIKDRNPDMAFVLSIAAASVVCIAAFEMAADIAAFAKELAEKSQMSSAVFAPLIKCAGISITVKLTCGLCKDAGQAALSAATEYVGAAAMLFTVLPLLKSLITTLGELT